MIHGRVSTMTYSTPPQNSTCAMRTDSELILAEERFQGYIGGKLVSLGFQLTNDAKGADYLVIYSYRTGEGEPEVYRSPDDGLRGKTVASNSTYPRYVHIGLVDRKASLEMRKTIFAFWGEVYGSSASTNDEFVTEYLIDQIFANYGQNVADVHFRAAFK
jgi:hypothetical protein